ncbi:unnamed protein product [Phaedon cochleariae]|uniref:Uncharacterized protein n=1 Tax=Phaedon cochleariae TaxID=80249 RepID=A0A9N9SC42_PHACE|nr:unnamed protein product [Phaedon cochleariae]
MPFFCHNGDPLSQPPPAHMGIPPYQLDSKGAATMVISLAHMYDSEAKIVTIRVLILILLQAMLPHRDVTIFGILNLDEKVM